MIGGRRPRLLARSIDVPCTVEIEHSQDSLHAHVELEGIDVGPGDRVTVHDAPVDVGFGERVVVRRQATVRQAGVIERIGARLSGYLELTELYEVSFSEERIT